MRYIVISVVVIASAACAAYLFWTTTPFFAFGQAGAAIVRHDPKLFDEYVNCTELVGSALEQVLIEPIQRTPGLTVLQQKVVAGALDLIVPPSTKALTAQLECYIAGENCTSRKSTPDIRSPQPQPRPGVPHEAFNLLSQIKEQEISSLSHAAHERVLNLSATHPDWLIGKLIALPKNERRQKLKQILFDHGLVPENFKGVTVSSSPSLEGEACKLAINFLPPGATQTLSVGAEMVKIPGGTWKIQRFLQLHDFLVSIEPGYDSEIQALVQCLLHDVTAGTVASEMKRVIQSRPAVKLMQGLKSRFSSIGLTTPESGTALRPLRSTMSHNQSALSLRNKLQKWKNRLDSPAPPAR